MMPIPCHSYLATAINANEAPCVSLYMPTHRSHPDNVQDPIRFKNLVKQVEESLNQAYALGDVQALLEPLHQLQDDDTFWNHTLDGLAILTSSARFDLFKICRTVPELSVVADTFHLKPLLRYVQSADQFHVLAVAEDKLALFEGNRYALGSISVPTISGTARTPAPSDPTAEVVGGRGIEGYFRAIDQAITEEISKLSEIPVVLAALPENIGQFRAIAKNPYLLPDSIVGDPFAFDTHELQVRAWAIVEPHYLSRLAKLSEDFGMAVSRQQGTGDLSDAAQAAIAGRIGTLLIDADQIQPGTIDPVTGGIKTQNLDDPTVDDKLDDLAELVLKTGGEVVIVPTERMPTETGLAAIFRY
ncbi:MAG: hypothetical protein ACRC8A_10740 [Microcoleaceae cyanobacterium]